MNTRAHISAVAACAWCVAWLLAGGCGSQPVAPPKEVPRVVLAADGGERITAAELDELTRAFADRYVGLLHSACDEVKRDNADAVQRREAQVLLLEGASNIYDIVSNADAFTRLLDLVVVTRLMSQVWVDDGRAAHVFGDRAEPMAKAILHARTEAQTLAERVLTVEQVGILETLISDWRKENPDMIRASFVRFSNFAIGRGRSVASEALVAGGLFADVGQVGQAVDEARLLGERVFYQLKREPTLLRWEVAAAKDDIFATPEVATALADVHRLTDLAEKLPAHIAREREAILAAVDARLAGANATVAGVKDVVVETRGLVASLEPASKSLDQMLKTADALFARYDAWDRWDVSTNAPPFQVRDYTTLVVESAAAAQRIDALLKSSNDLVASREWQARIDEWNRSADGRIENMAMQSRLLFDNFFRRVYVALGVLCALVLGYRVVSILLVRRPASPPVAGGHTQ